MIERYIQILKEKVDRRIKYKGLLNRVEINEIIMEPLMEFLKELIDEKEKRKE